MSTVYIGIGSNLGDREKHIEDATRRVRELPGVVEVRGSSLYETEPVGGPPQGPFLNGALCVETALEPLDLLRGLQAIEAGLKRERVVKWGPRTIDLDILLFDDLVLQTPDLIIPHPLMHERDFVLRPLNEIAPDVVHPVLELTTAELLSELSASRPST